MKIWFLYITAALMFGATASIMFVPTGANGEWTFIDYFNAIVTVPLYGICLYVLYKKLGKSKSVK